MRNKREKPTRTQGMGIVSIPLRGEGGSSWREKILMEKRGNNVGNGFSCILCQFGESGGKKWRLLRAKPAFSWVPWCFWGFFLGRKWTIQMENATFSCIVATWFGTGMKVIPRKPKIWEKNHQTQRFSWIPHRCWSFFREKTGNSTGKGRIFFVVPDRDEGSAMKMKKTGKKLNKCGDFPGFQGGG